MKNWSLSRRLAIGFGLVLLLTTACVVIGWRSLQLVCGDVVAMKAKGVDTIAASGALESKLWAVRMGHYRAETPIEPAKRAEVVSGLRKSVEEFDAELKGFAQYNRSSDDVKLYTDLVAAWTSYAGLDLEWFKLMDAGKVMEATTFAETQLAPISREKMLPAMKAVREDRIKDGATLSKEANDQVAASIVLLVSAGVIALGLGIAVASLIARSIQKPVVVLERKMGELAADGFASLVRGVEGMELGDLTRQTSDSTTPIDVVSNDEVGRLGKTFNFMLSGAQSAITAFNSATSSMRNLVKTTMDKVFQIAQTSSRLSEGADDLAEASHRIRESADRLAQSARESSNAAEQIAKGSEDLARESTNAAERIAHVRARLDAVARAASEQKEMAASTLDASHSVTQSIDKSIEAMELVRSSCATTGASVQELDAKQAEIGEIVQTIESIAAQTNLLALNAAIEAARAGEQGRGFAVVADEVRSLAEQAAQATGVIASLIGAIRANVLQASSAMELTAKSVEQGVELIDEAKQAIGSVVTTARCADGLATQTTQAIQDVAMDVDKFADSTTSVAAVSEEAASAAEELSAMSEQTSASIEEVLHAIIAQDRATETVRQEVLKLDDLAVETSSIMSQFTSENWRATLEGSKKAHLNWVKRVDDMLAGGEPIPMRDLVSHTRCRLGTWYGGVGRRVAGHVPEYEALEHPHAAVHAGARKATEAWRAGDTAAAKAAQADVRAASQRVCELLDAIYRRLEAEETQQKAA